MKEIKAPKLVAANEENMSISTELFEKTKKELMKFTNVQRIGNDLDLF